MAILRAVDGTYYEVPDDQVSKYKIPEDELKAKIGSQGGTEGGGPPEGPPDQGGASPLVNVQIYYTGGAGGGGAPAGAGAEAGAVQPYDWRNWRNWHNWNNWRNWRNRWD